MISEYRKARALMADVAAQAKEGVWHNLFLEVEKVRALLTTMGISWMLLCIRPASQ